MLLQIDYIFLFDKHIHTHTLAEYPPLGGIQLVRHADAVSFLNYDVLEYYKIYVCNL